MAVTGPPSKVFESGGGAASARDLRLLVLAPWGRDGALIADTLESAGIGCEVCEDVANFDTAIEHLGALLFTAEALTSDVLARLDAAMDSQPPWSYTPVILLLRSEAAAWRGESGAFLRRLVGQVTVLELPLDPEKLVSVARWAIETRVRQHEARDARRTLEATVVRRDSSLRRSALELTRAEQHARQRLAHLLHDDVQQLLVAAQMHLVLLADRVQDAGSTGILDTVRGLLAEAVLASRLLASDLSPPALGRGGLGKALVRLGVQMRDLHRLTVTVDVDEAIEVSEATTATFLLDATRELLFNVVKHAGVSLAHVELVEVDDEVRVTIEDHGHGLPARGGPKVGGPGFGLARIRERLEDLGGRMVESVPRGGGHRILIAVPLPRTKRSVPPLRSVAS